MLPLLGILAVLLIGIVSAGAAAGKYYNKRRWKKMKRHNKLKKRNRSPSDELEEDLELGHEDKSVEIDKSENPIAAEAEEMEEDVVEELMKVHNLSGPARFLFTIEEETTEELKVLEDEKKSKKKTRKSLIDLMSESDGKFLKPISCPVIKSTRSLTGSVFQDGNVLVKDIFDRSNLNSFRSTEATPFGKMQLVTARG